MRIAAVIVAAGSGSRAGDGPAKQWRTLGGRTVLRWSAEALLAAGVSPLVVVVPAGDGDRTADCLAGLDGWISTPGGAVRADSVKAGLAALGELEADAAVLVHDAARPFVAAQHLEALTAAMAGHDGAIPALPVADTLKRRDGGAPETTVSRATTSGAPRRRRPSGWARCARPMRPGRPTRASRPTTPLWSSAPAARWRWRPAIRC